MQPSAPKPATGDPTDPRRSQESQGVTVPPGSSRVTHSRSHAGPHVPSGSAGKSWLCTTAVPGDSLCSDPEPGTAGGSSADICLPAERGRALVLQQVSEAWHRGQDATLLLHVELRRGQSAARLLLIAADGELQR